MNRVAFSHPAAYVARGIENLYIKRENSDHFIAKSTYGFLARAVSVTAFPLSLIIELVFKRIPKTLACISFTNDQKKAIKLKANIEKIQKLGLGILFSPLGIRSPDAVSGFFLKTFQSARTIRPFGVETQYGKAVDGVIYPQTIEDLQKWIKCAKTQGKQVSVIGAGMCQGEQTIPARDNHLIIHTKYLNKIEFLEGNTKAKVQSGAIWEELQIQANQLGKSVIAKQASDVFSIGGSIGINCHGWAHEAGAIASTVESLEIIDAEGNLRTLTPDDEMFGCFFGTFGYFGVIVSATLKLVDNEHLIEKTEEVELDDFVSTYEEKIKGKDIPLFGGRLVLDNMEGNPLRKVCMVRYERDIEANQAQGDTPLQSPDFIAEPKRGTRFERIALQAIGHLSYFSARRILSSLWTSERDKMLEGRKITRNDALHPPIKAFMMLHESNLHAQWLQEYFIKKENLANFLRYLGAQIKAYDVRLINATIRPTPQDSISVLPYAEQDRYAVVICFDQFKTEKAIQKTQQWIQEVNAQVIAGGDVYYQAYMPYTTREQFEQCYGEERVKKLRELKAKYDPDNRFGNAHTAKYFDKN